MRNTNYLALDLELNTEQGKTTYIIEVGVAIGNITDGIIFKKQWFVKPSRDLSGTPLFDNTLSDFIVGLTGITQEDYDSNTTDLSVVATELRGLINEYDTFVNPVTWGIGDSEELKTTFKQEGIDFPCFGCRIIDVKNIFIFIEAANGRALSGGLRNAMNKYKIKFEGKPHRAATDAENTLRFFFHLLKRQNTLEEIVRTSKSLPY